MPSGSHGSWMLAAELHKPDGDALQAEIRRLRQTGLKSYDIASTLHIGVAAVEQVLSDGAGRVQALGHGWVRPLPSGAKARCGGPAICRQCQLEQEGAA
jgi:hypothetical protein